MKVVAQAVIGRLNVPASANFIVGATNGELVLKTRDLDLGPAPSQLRDQIAATLDQSLTSFAGQLTLVVDRVAFRGGCIGHRDDAHRRRPGQQALTRMVLSY